MSRSGNSAHSGFYETFRTSGGRPHHWRYNLTRLRQACGEAGIELPRAFMANDAERLTATVREALRQFEVEDAVFRYEVKIEGDAAVPAAFRRSGANPGPTEHLAPRPLPVPAPAHGIALRVLRVTREPSARQSRPKILNDANLRSAAEEIHARATGASDEGLMLSREGAFVVETSRQNVFWISNGHVFFPAPALGGVAGTCLAWLLDRGLAALPVSAPLGQLLDAEAVAVCNSVRGITPVAEIWDVDDRSPLRQLPSASHPLIAQLSAAWHESLAATSTQ